MQTSVSLNKGDTAMLIYLYMVCGCFCPTVLQQRPYGPKNQIISYLALYRKKFDDPCSSLPKKALIYLQEEWARKE